MEGRKLKRTIFESEGTMKYGNETNKEMNCGMYVFELLNSATAIHILHLSIKGTGSNSKHLALKEYYEGIVDIADDLAESYQGFKETILDYPTTTTVNRLSSLQEAVIYLKEIYSKSEEVYRMVSASEILATIDLVKELINKTKYKLMFLE